MRDVGASRSDELRELARRVADVLPASVVEVLLTGSVSRGVADELSDIELLVVTRSPLGLEEAYELAAGAGLEGLDSWGAQETPAKRVSGFRGGVSLELTLWPREYAESSFEGLLAGARTSAADAVANGVVLRTSGLLAAWQARLRNYPEELAARLIEDAALPWGGFTPAGVLTLVRPGDRLALVEWMLD